MLLAGLLLAIFITYNVLPCHAAHLFITNNKAHQDAVFAAFVTVKNRRKIKDRLQKKKKKKKKKNIQCVLSIPTPVFPYLTKMSRCQMWSVFHADGYVIIPSRLTAKFK